MAQEELTSLYGALRWARRILRLGWRVLQWRGKLVTAAVTAASIVALVKGSYLVGGGLAVLAAGLGISFALVYKRGRALVAERRERRKIQWELDIANADIRPNPSNTRTSYVEQVVLKNVDEFTPLYPPFLGHSRILFSGVAIRPETGPLRPYAAAYHKLAPLNYLVRPGDHLVYSIFFPDNPAGNAIGVQLVFCDGTNSSLHGVTSDQRGFPAHPACRYVCGSRTWHECRFPLGHWVGKRIEEVQIAFDAGETKNTGAFCAYLDYIAIENR